MATPDKFRVNTWIDTSNLAVDEYPLLYGVQARVGRKWYHVARGDKPVLFDSPEKAEAEVARRTAERLPTT